MRALALTLALAAPGGALAQDACDRPLEALRLGAVPSMPWFTQARAALADDGWCEAPDVVFQHATFASGVDVRMALLRWRGEGLDALLDGTGLPTALEVEAEGMRVVPVTGDATMDWLLAAQAAPRGIDARMALRWDADAREMRLETLEIDLPGRSAVRATGVVAAVDLSSLSAAQGSLGSMSVTRASVEVVAEGLFEAWLLMPLGGTLLTGVEDPASEAKRLRARAVAAIGAMPDALAPEPSRAALAALVSELPNPVGRLTLEVEAVEGGGLGLPRFARFAMTGMPRSPEALWDALEGVSVAAGWEPLPPEG